LVNDPVVASAAAGVARALAHPVRLQILELLRDEGAYVMHLTAALGRPQANISQHLGILREAGLVMDEREGMTVIYRVRDPRVFDLVDRLKALAALPAGPAYGPGRRGALSRQRARLGKAGQGCRCPRCRAR
jgi:DNA-binding transcriptional ArsR family regulator